jgi:hypothetical protein
MRRDLGVTGSGARLRSPDDPEAVTRDFEEPDRGRS